MPYLLIMKKQQNLKLSSAALWINMVNDKEEYRFLGFLASIMSKAKLMLGNAVEISLPRILGPFVLGWAPNHFVLGAQLAPGEKRFVSIPALLQTLWTQIRVLPLEQSDQGS